MTSFLPTSPYRRGALIRSHPFRDLRFRIFLKDQPNRPVRLAEIGTEADLCRRAQRHTAAGEMRRERKLAEHLADVRFAPIDAIVDISPLPMSGYCIDGDVVDLSSRSAAWYSRKRGSFEALAIGAPTMEQMEKIGTAQRSSLRLRSTELC